ncbi:MAG: protein kinase [Clostridiales bacterium]|jgi:serine/threonine protein kinase|nr:protein kinase [Clostridiales bacterium]
MADIKKYEPLWGSWMIEELIGRGECSEVYKVKRTVSDMVEQAAVKFISFPNNASELDELKGTVKHDRLKARIAELAQDIIADFNTMQKLSDCSSLVHFREIKHVPHKDGYGFDLLILMDYHQSLEAYVSEQGLKSVLNGAARLAQDAAIALEAFHKENIVHANVKPSNIFVDSSGSFLLGGRSAINRIDKRLSLPQYKQDCTCLSPESYSSFETDSSDDLYSLGIVLYSCLNGGRMPFLPPVPESLTDDDRANAFSSRTDGKLIAPPPGVDDLFGKIIAKACSFKKESRYHNPVQFQRAMKDYVRWKKRYLSIQELDPKSGQLSKDKVLMLKEAEKNKSDARARLLYIDEPPAISGFEFCLDTLEEVELEISDSYDEYDDEDEFDEDDELVDLSDEENEFEEDEFEEDELDEDEEDEDDEDDDDEDDDSDYDDSDFDEEELAYDDYELVKGKDGTTVLELVSKKDSSSRSKEKSRSSRNRDSLTQEELDFAKAVTIAFNAISVITSAIYAILIVLRLLGIVSNATLAYTAFLALSPLAKVIFHLSGKKTWALHVYAIFGTLNFVAGLIVIDQTFWRVALLLFLSVTPMLGKKSSEFFASTKTPRKKRSS